MMSVYTEPRPTGARVVARAPLQYTERGDAMRGASWEIHFQQDYMY